MQFNSLFTGKLVRMAAPTPDDFPIMKGWTDNDEYLRLADGDPARPQSLEQVENFEKEIFGDKDTYFFHIRTLDDDRLIGSMGLFNFRWKDGSAEFGIVIGDPEYWGKGYGSDATQIMLHYCFHELNLHRVSLQVLGYNTRAVRAYEKCGFVKEGVQREALKRDGQRWDILNYAILYDEWVAMQK
jgi:RimJ/RimL family protein N-acetyltransferase